MLDHLPSRRHHHGVSAPGLLALIVVIALAVWGVVHRLEARAALREAATENSIVTVAVTQPAVAGAGEDLVLPGNVQPWSDAPVYARTSGYLKRWMVDIGASVKAGQLLAEIETPEVDDQLRQAAADLGTAKANAALANSTAARWQELFHNDLASKQDTDEKNGDAQAKKAALASAEANLARLRQLVAFKRITAPFDGVVTARNVDVGSLVNAGAGQALFQIAAVQKLRVYAEVPQAYAASIRPGLEASLVLADHPGEKFVARVSNTASSLGPDTHSLRTQLELDNHDGRLLPGGYAEVHFKLPSRPDSLRLPANALLFRADGLQVATLDSGDRVTLKAINLGRDFGATVEVLGGLSGTDTVVLNPPDSIVNGEVVHRSAPAAKPEAPVAAK